jgi:lysozyme family protein
MNLCNKASLGKFPQLDINITIERINMQTDFERALEFVLRFEGRYVNHPKDPGGATFCGVTQRTYDQYLFDKNEDSKDVRNITYEEIRDIYENLYWKASYAHVMPWPVNIVVMDYAVNSGPGKAIKSLQKALGVTADGVVGPKTLKAIDEIKNAHEIAGEIIHEREDFYKAIVDNKPTQRIFLVGWLNRTAGLRKAIKQN